MSYQELRLTLERARAGMTLARAVLDLRGQVLVAAGAELNDSIIRSLHRRDIAELWVLDPEQSGESLLAQDARLRQQRRERLALLLRHAGDGAEDRYLRELMERYRGVERP